MTETTPSPTAAPLSAGIEAFLTEIAGLSLRTQDTYRTGDATPENNLCKPIPPGYKLAVAEHELFVG